MNFLFCILPGDNIQIRKRNAKTIRIITIIGIPADGGLAIDNSEKILIKKIFSINTYDDNDIHHLHLDILIVHYKEDFYQYMNLYNHLGIERNNHHSCKVLKQNI